MMAPPQDFVVRLARSGLSVQIGARDTILAAVRRAGVAVPASCTAGTCGACETAVLAGTPLHRDQIIDRTAAGADRRIMLCCSRSRTRELTLDL